MPSFSDSGTVFLWQPTGSYSPKRALRALRAICDILKRFDVIAVQEVCGDLAALRQTVTTLGPAWSFLMTDITRGSKGGGERLAYIFNTTRLHPSGLAGEVVIPPEWTAGESSTAVLTRQFARTPYAVSFRAGTETFILLTAHIDYGQSASSRIPEISAVSHWMSNWASTANRFHHNLILLGDFNIDRSGSPLRQALTASGLTLPKELETVKRSIFINDGDDPRLHKYYDQIVWFSDGAGKKALTLSYRNAGSFDFLPYLYREEAMSKRSVSYRISDHYPLWVEFGRGVRRDVLLNAKSSSSVRAMPPCSPRPALDK